MLFSLKYEMYGTLSINECHFKGSLKMQWCSCDVRYPLQPLPRPDLDGGVQPSACRVQFPRGPQHVAGQEESRKSNLQL